MYDAPRGGPLYKILPASAWAATTACVPWSAVDRADGFVHLSAAHQVRETARRHFAGQSDLCLLEIDVARIPEGALRWEPSRGGDWFPHVYGDVPSHAVVGVDPLRQRDGAFAFPAHVPIPLAAEPPPDACALALEIAEAANMLGLGRAALQATREADPAYVVRGLAVATRFGPSSPINAIKGWGLRDEVEPADLDALEQPFLDVGAGFAVEVSSCASSEALRVLAERGYRAVATENVLFAALHQVPPPATTMTLRAVADGETDAWAELLARGFGASASDLSQYGRIAHALGHARASFLVVEGARVGTCGMRLHHDIAVMHGAAVLAEHRCRGYHRDSLVLRMAAARALGCRWAKVDTQPGSGSHRNAHRLGFRLSHTRTIFQRHA